MSSSSPDSSQSDLDKRLSIEADLWDIDEQIDVQIPTETSAEEIRAVEAKGQSPFANIPESGEAKYKSIGGTREPTTPAQGITYADKGSQTQVKVVGGRQHSPAEEKPFVPNQQISDLPPVSKRPIEREPSEESLSTQEGADTEESINREENAPQATKPEEPSQKRKKRRAKPKKLSKPEKLSVGVVLLSILGCCLFLTIALAKQITNQKDDRLMPPFPLSGSSIEIKDAKTYWLIGGAKGSGETKLDGPFVPHVDLTISSSSQPAQLRLYFINEEGTIIGDPITRPVNPGEVVSYTSTKGFEESGDFTSYTAGFTETWFVVCLEAPSSTEGSNAQFNEIARLPISSFLKED